MSPIQLPPLDASSLPPCSPSEVALQRQARRMASLPQTPWLHQEAARRLADKLAPIKLEPTSWIDWSAFLGAGAELVQARYPQAQRWVVEPTEGLRQRSQTELVQGARKRAGN